MKLLPEQPILATADGAVAQSQRNGRSARKWGRWYAIGALLSCIVIAGLSWPWLSAPQVHVSKVIRAAVVQTVVASGRIETPRRIDIGSQVSGAVAAMPVEEGQAVKKGSALIILEQGEAAAALDQARATVAQAEIKMRQISELNHPLAVEAMRQAEANGANARRQFERNLALFGRGFVGQVALDDARRNLDLADSQLASAQAQERSLTGPGSEVQMARASLEQARAALRLAQVRLAYTTIQAPVDGVLIARAVERGDVVQPGKALLVLSPDGPTQAVVQIDEKNMALLRLGQPATVSADAYPADRFDAVISYINSAVDPQRGAVEVKLNVTHPPAYLRQDMTVSVEIAVARKNRALVVPTVAVHDSAGPAAWVWKVNERRVARQPVVPGISGELQKEVLAGLHEGETVVSEAGTGLAERQRIRPLDLAAQAGRAGPPAVPSMGGR